MRCVKIFYSKMEDDFWGLGMIPSRSLHDRTSLYPPLSFLFIFFPLPGWPCRTSSRRGRCPCRWRLRRERRWRWGRATTRSWPASASACPSPDTRELPQLTNPVLTPTWVSYHLPVNVNSVGLNRSHLWWDKYGISYCAFWKKGLEWFIPS